MIADHLEGLSATVVRTTLYWTCGHVTTHGPDHVPAACPVCCGTTFIRARITEEVRK